MDKTTAEQECSTKLISKPDGIIGRIRLRRIWSYLIIFVGTSIILISTQYKGAVKWYDAEVPVMSKPWFMRNGYTLPNRTKVDRITGRHKARLWPQDSDGDRIVEQLMYVPFDYPKPEDRSNTKLKKILVYHNVDWMPVQEGRETFLSAKCPVDTCELTNDRRQVESADAVLFRDMFGQNEKGLHRPSWEQVWIFFVLESPYHTNNFPCNNTFNWTATYRHDSDIVFPYDKFVPYDRNHIGDVKYTPLRNYAANKTKKVAWFVSNCNDQNGRKEYAEELSKYIAVDVFGGCGHLKCPRTNEKSCYEMLNNDYKFYLSFENSNCKDYITEKFFTNALSNSVIPVVMGARKEDYKRVAPTGSYIYLEDFASPKELSDYLHLLDRNDTLYNEYFLWKGTGEFVKHYVWCRICAMLHDNHPPKVYEDLNDWWNGPRTCVRGRWNGKPWW